MSGKKKLVYKQDPDGVFRLKKLGDSDKLSTKSDKRTVDDYLNDLITCTYQVVNPNKEETHQDDMESLVSGDPKSSIPEVVDVDVFEKLSPVKEFSPGLHIGVDEELVKPQTPKLEVPVGSSLLPLGKKLISMDLIFHVPSFGIGMIVTIILARFSPWLTYCGVMVFNYLKVGILWAIILGGLAWYGGLIKVQDLRSLKDKVMQTVKPQDSKQEPTVNEPPKVPPLMAQASEVFDQFEGPLNEIPVNRKYERKPRKPTSPTIRKNTNIIPFKPQIRPTTAPAFAHLEEKSPSVPDLSAYDKPQIPKFNRTHTTEPKSNYSKFIERSRKHRPSTSMDSFDYNRMNHGPLTPPHDQPLPTLPDEELPFINQVKLMNNNEDYVSDMPTFNLGRLNTTGSKKSVLGTRVNYNKFIDNAGINYD